MNIKRSKQQQSRLADIGIVLDIVHIKGIPFGNVMKYNLSLSMTL